ncbi:MAG: metallophosphoesterase [Myxococcota bacterium]|nr:metallophosphoesterase [Myxococcota bacterium]
MLRKSHGVTVLFSAVLAMALGCSDESSEGASDTNTDQATASEEESDSNTGTEDEEGTDTNGGILPWKFIVIGDSRGSDNGVNTAAWGHLVTAIVSEEADFILFSGDLTTAGQASELEQWKTTSKPLYDAGMGVYAVRGNHDDSSLSTWNDAFSGDAQFPQNGPSDQKNLTYSVTHKNVFFAAIENYSADTEVPQAWLDVELAANTAPHVFVFGHEPAFAADHADTLDDHPGARDQFWESLKAAGARTYFCGHDHFYDHARIGDGDGNDANDLHQFIVGTAGAPFYDFDGGYPGNNGDYDPVQEHFSDQYGYVLVLIDGLKVSLVFKERNGDVYEEVDSFEYTAQ